VDVRIEADEAGAMPEVEDVARPVRILGRAGLLAYGAVHLLIAALVVRVAFGERERTDKKGALAEIGATAVGVVLLWVVTAGLVALVVWQLGEAVLGHRGVPTGQRALRVAINLAEAALFGVLAYSAATVAGAGGQATAKPSFAQVVLGLPGGPVLVGLAGVGLVVGGGYAVWRGITHAFLRELDLRGAGLNRSRLVTRIGRVGWAALGVAYVIPGVLLLVAAVQHDPAQPVGLDPALKELALQPFGPVLLLALAAGLLAFGVHCLFDARYRRG
jgi:hypothetical protein